MVSSTGQEAERTSQHRLCDLKQAVRSDFLLPRLYSVKVSHEAAVELVWVAQSCASLLHPVDCRLPGSSVRGLPQAGRLEWVAMFSSRGSSRPRD